MTNGSLYVLVVFGLTRFFPAAPARNKPTYADIVRVSAVPAVPPISTVVQRGYERIVGIDSFSRVRILFHLVVVILVHGMPVLVVGEPTPPTVL